MKKVDQPSRRKFIKTASLAALGTTVAGSLGSIGSVQAATKAVIKNDQGGPYNILMIVTDQEQHLKAEDLPILRTGI